MASRGWVRGLGFGVALFAAAGCGEEAAKPAAEDAAAVEDAATLGDAPLLVAPDANGEDVAGAPGKEPSAPVGGWLADELRAPRAVHLTWQNDPATTMTVAWSTADTDLGAYRPKLWLAPTAAVEANGGQLPYADGLVLEGTGETYRESLLGIEVGETTYVVWTVEATGLEPETSYTYRVGTWDAYDPATGALTNATLSEPRTFRTGRLKGQREPFEVVLAGDSRGGHDEIAQRIDRFAAIPADFWIFNGDMTQSGLQEEWDPWMDAMEPLVSERVLMPVQGNHEVFANVYYAQFALPREVDLPEELQENAWSLDYGNVHFIGLNSNSTELVEDQVAWLEADLAAAKADPDIDWIVATMHHAPYSASKHGSTERLQAHWVPLFEQHGVDLVFSGHDHNYERSHPVRGGEVVGAGEGVTYVVAGSFFAPPYKNGQEWWTAVSHHGDKRNYVRMKVDGKTVTLTAWDGEGAEVLDEVTLSKP